MKICAVILADAGRSYDKIYDYRVPDELEMKLRTGMRVSVPFGSKDKPRTAWFLSFVDRSKYEKLKEIRDVIDDEPLLDEDMFRLAKMIRDRYFCSYGTAISTMLPSGMNIKREKYILTEDGNEIPYSEFGSDSESLKGAKIVYRTKKAANAKVLKAARLSLPRERAVELIENSGFTNVRHMRVLERLPEYGEITISDFESYESISRNIIKGMEKKGFLEIFDKQVQRYKPAEPSVGDIKRHRMNKYQQSAFDEMIKPIEEGKFDSFLLHGVTGSGKTEVYLNLAEKATAAGKQVIVLVPEISLTPMMIDRFNARFSGKLAVLHSKLSMGERYDQWMNIKHGMADIALGARSCIFAPFDRLGLIIIDEEHEPSYISERTPRYNAAEVALMRCRLSDSVLVSGSATPSVESYTRYKKQNRLLTLPDRAGKGSLPQVEVVDMKDEISAGRTGVISRKLKERLAENIREGNQAMLFLNRRGYASMVLCRECGHTSVCPDCDVSLTYHRKINSLVCHYCGHMEPVPLVCPSCGSAAIRKQGIGTQKVEEEVRREFPKASVIRMDSDETGLKNSHMQILERFRDEHIDVLIGTQMIAKGHDFPDITLVGILAADTLAAGFDYSSQERAFQLITQAAGRAGRAEKPGTAVVQAYNTDSYAVEYGVSQDYSSFYKREMKLREAFGYPPFGQIAVMLFSSFSDSKAGLWADKASGYLRRHGTEVSDAAYAPVSRINRRYRYRVVAKSGPDKDLGKAIREMYLGLVLKKPADVAFSVDVRGGYGI